MKCLIKDVQSQILLFKKDKEIALTQELNERINLNGEKDLVDHLILDEALKYYKINLPKFIGNANLTKIEPYYDYILHHINLLFQLNMKKTEENLTNITQNQSKLDQTILYETKLVTQHLIDFEKIDSESLIKLWNSLAIPIQYYIFYIIFYRNYVRYHYFGDLFKDKMTIYQKIWLW